jgi:F0F1-type ATP synthase assembly protein I
MTKTTAPKMTPSPKEVDKAQTSEGGNDNTLMVFVGAIVDLSWRMALVVLIPIIGGYELDKHLKTEPSFTILGFILAMLGTFLVLKQMLKVYGGQSVSNSKENK